MVNCEMTKCLSAMVLKQRLNINLHWALNVLDLNTFSVQYKMFIIKS